jgi:hypothetical protein
VLDENKETVTDSSVELRDWTPKLLFARKGEPVPNDRVRKQL